jgi:hypothetical protein
MLSCSRRHDCRLNRSYPSNFCSFACSAFPILVCTHTLPLSLPHPLLLQKARGEPANRAAAGLDPVQVQPFLRETVPPPPLERQCLLLAPTSALFLPSGRPRRPPRDSDHIRGPDCPWPARHARRMVRVGVGGVGAGWSGWCGARRRGRAWRWGRTGGT